MIDVVTYKYAWWRKSYRVNLPLGKGQALVDDLSKHPGIEWVKLEVVNG